MKILMLTPYLPYPLFSGGQIRSYNIIKELAKNHDITLFALFRNDNEKEYISELKKYCKKVVIFKRKKPFQLDNILLSAFTSWPFILHVYDNRELKKALEEELDKETYDVIHVETFYIMHDIPKTKVPIILFEQNIEYKVYERIARYFKPAIIRPLLFLDARKIRHWEEYFWKNVSAVVVMSAAEKTAIGDMAFVSGNGVDTDFYQPQKRKKDARILFLGNFKWFQSLDAAQFIISEIWPLLKTKLPDAKLFIIGKNIPEGLKKKGHSDIIFDENAPNDTRKIYENADLLLAPIRAGGGASFKVLESMATGLPVVTTQLVAEVLLAQDGKELLVADKNDPKMFAEKTMRLLEDRELYLQIAKNARKLVEEKYSWKILVSQIEKIYTSVLS